MSVRFVSGDLFQFEGLKAYAHGCNCAGRMGRGIAVEFKNRFPTMYEEYAKRCAKGKFNLGDVFTWRSGDETIFNLGTQTHWTQNAEMPAIETALKKMVKAAETLKIPRVGLPRIGAGLGGLPWEPIKALMEKTGSSTSVEMVVFETWTRAPLKSEQV